MAIDSKYGYIDIPGIPDDMPVFIVIGRDPIGGPTVKFYTDRRNELLPHDYEFQRRSEQTLRDFANCQKRLPT